MLAGGLLSLRSMICHILKYILAYVGLLLAEILFFTGSCLGGEK